MRGLKVPDDISIIGFDDIVLASQITPALTTVSVPVEEIAKLSIELLDSAMNENGLKYQHTALPCQLVLRETSAEINNSSPAARKLKA